MSGSCTARTCWNTLPAFRAIGNRLSSAYDRARQVEPIRGRREMRPLYLKLRRSTPSDDYDAARRESRKPPAKRLVYLVRSPDFCSHRKQFGVDGTSGRTCGLRIQSSTAVGQSSPSLTTGSSSSSWPRPQPVIVVGDRSPKATGTVAVSAAVDHCDSMCCGRGFESQVDVIVRRCRCQFRWCCYVVCDTCTDVREELVCR